MTWLGGMEEDTSGEREEFVLHILKIMGEIGSRRIINGLLNQGKPLEKKKLLH